jgi:TetR/AcrR family acrAB operon transcriptional repressor
MRKTKEEAEKTRNKILKSALQVFLKNGYSRTSLTDIAENAGYTRGAVYWHFKDKSEILEKLISKFHLRFSTLQSEILESSLDPLDKVKGMIGINLPLLYNNREFRDFIELTWFKTEIDQHKGLLEGKTAITEAFNNTVTHLLREAQMDGSLKEDVDPEIAALTLTSIINGIYRGYFILPDKLKSERTGKTMIENYLNHLTKH